MNNPRLKSIIERNNVFYEKGYKSGLKDERKGRNQGQREMAYIALGGLGSLGVIYLIVSNL